MTIPASPRHNNKKRTIMKPILSLALALCLAMPAIAQIQETTAEMSRGARNALVLSIPETDSKLVEDVWQDFCKDELRTKAKWDRKEKEYLTEDVTIIAISPNPIDLYARAEEAGDDIAFYLWFDLGGAFLASDSLNNDYLEGEKVLMEFGLAVAAEKTRQELAEQEKVLKDMEREMEKLQRLNERYHDDIEKAKDAIKAAEADIEANLAEQKKMKEQLAEQNRLIKTIAQKLKDLR